MTITAAGQAPAYVPVRNVVLVHGAWADGSSWAAVTALLQANGVKVTAVQLPLNSLAADVAATRWAIGRENGPTLLCGHSYGGVVISEAGNDPDVVGLVYVAALAPEAGEAFADLARRFPTPAGGAHIVVRDGLATLDPEGFADNFAQDLPRAEALALAASQGPIGATLFDEKTTVAAWQGKPSWYAVSSQDRMVAPNLQRFLAERMQAETFELDTSHASPITRSREISELILRAAGRRF